MDLILLILLIIVAVFLIALILMQRSEGGALGIGGGGGGMLSTRGQATLFTRLTWWLGIAFLVLTLLLAFLSSQRAKDGSVIESLAATGAATATTPLVIDTPALPTPTPAPATTEPSVPVAP